MKLREHQQKAVDVLREYNKGQIIVPTGGGKTMIAITDALHQLKHLWDYDKNSKQFIEPKTIVVVAPRILLAQQLSSEFLDHLDVPVSVLHVHSGETEHYSTTNRKEIFAWVEDYWHYNKIIFTTYHSLHKIQRSGIPVDTIYFDEAHNSVQRHFYPATEFYAGLDNVRCYFFTATPKYNKSVESPSMDDEEVYGKEIERITPRELIANGYILPPKLSIKELEMTEAGRTPVWKECDHLLETIDECSVDKVLICARRISQIVNLIDDTNFCKELSSRGYSWMYITSKTGGIIDGMKVDREEFFDTLSDWGKEDDKRFVVLHHSILSEGINVPGLEAALFMRNMNTTAISQTIGRVIRTGDTNKKFGLIAVPVYDRVGIKTAKSVNAVVDTILA